MISNIVNTSAAPVTMTSREVAELADARHNDVCLTIERLFLKGLLRSSRETRTEATGGRPTAVYDLIERDTYIIMAGYSDEVRARIVDRWQELEAKQAAPAALSVMDILHIAMEAEKGRLLAIEQRDHAIKTKAQIGSKREATALANTAKANREAARLRDELGFSARHATILQVEDAMHGDFDFVPLRRWCKANEVTPATVPDKRYPKGVKAWPAGAWANVFGVDLMDLFGEVTA